MDIESRLPPGFRFHPTEEELVGYYLARKVACQKIDLEVIREVDLYRIEPWDLQGRCKHGNEEQTEWYFFSFKDRKYPSGTRTNRATAAGFWKATGRDKPVLSHSRVIGMRKTLVFYKGRAPNGRRTDWIMHEYRLQTSERAPTQEEGWVVCRAFQKPTPNQRPCDNSFCPTYYRNFDAQYGHEEGFADMSRTTNFMNSYLGINSICERSAMLLEEMESKQDLVNQVLDIPRLDSPSLSTSLTTRECIESSAAANHEHSSRGSNLDGQLIDWKVLDNLLFMQNESASSNLPAAVGSCEEGIQSQADHFLTLFDNSYC